MFSKVKNEVTPLKSRKKIEILFNKGRRFENNGLQLVCNKVNNRELALGFGVSKKLFPKAVDRNKIKRLMRAQFKLIRQNPSYEVFFGDGFFVYNSKEIPTLSSLELPMKKLISQWGSLVKAT